MIFKKTKNKIIQNPDVVIKHFQDSPQTTLDELKTIDFNILTRALINYDTKTIAYILKEFDLEDIKSFLKELTPEKKSSVINFLPASISAQLVNANLEKYLV
jgi:hypothetical protein